MLTPRFHRVLLRLLLLAMLGAMTGCHDPEPSDPPFDYCTPDSPPDAQCYADKRDPTSDNIALARAIADKQIATHTPETVEWDWGDSVMMLSLVELYRVTGEITYRDYYQAWIDHHIEVGYEIETSDKCPPALAALNLYEELGDEKYRQIASEVIDYLDNRALRTEEGGISHLGTVDVFGPTLWLDSLFMFGNVWIRWAELTSSPTKLNQYEEQFQIFTSLLQDESGLYTHAAHWVLDQEEGLFWARGNAWLTAATYDYLRARRIRNETDTATEKALARQVTRILELQDSASGLWWTVLSHPDDLYTETSASALFVYGLARAWRYGFQNETVLTAIAAAMTGIHSRIELDSESRPIVKGTSGPTNAGDWSAYANVPQLDDVNYGIGAVILSLIETSGLPLPEGQ